MASNIEEGDAVQRQTGALLEVISDNKVVLVIPFLTCLGGGIVCLTNKIIYNSTIHFRIRANG